MFVFSSFTRLNDYIASLRKRIGDRPIAVSGSGVSSRKLLSAMLDNGMTPCMFVDNNNALVGSHWLGIPVKHPAALARVPQVAVIISSVPHAKSMSEQAVKYGLTEESDIFPGYPEEVFAGRIGPAEYATCMRNWPEAARLWTVAEESLRGKVLSAFSYMQMNQPGRAVELLGGEAVRSDPLGLFVLTELALRRQNIDEALHYWTELKGLSGSRDLEGYYPLTARLLTVGILSEKAGEEVRRLLVSELLAEPGENRADFVPAIISTSFELIDHYRPTFDKLRELAEAAINHAGESETFLSAELTALCLRLRLSDPRFNSALLFKKYALDSSLRRLCYIFNLDNGLDGLLRDYVGELCDNDRLSEISAEHAYNFISILALIEPALCDKVLESFSGLHGPAARSADDPVSAVLVVSENRKKTAVRRPARIAGPLRAIKVAVCVSGQLRGFREARRTWSNLGIPGERIDYFVHVWEDIGRKYPVPIHAHRVFSGSFLKAYREAAFQVGMDGLERRYPALFNYFNSSGKATVDGLKDFYRTENVLVEDDLSDRFRGFCNSTKMHYKIQSCFELVEEASEIYDLVIRIRPDLIIGKPEEEVDWEKLRFETRNRSVIFADWAMKIGWFGIGIGDLFAAGARDTMAVYSHTYDVTEQAKIDGAYGILTEYWGHRNLGLVALRNGISVEKVPGLEMSRVCDPETIGPEIVLGLVLQDTGPSARDRIDSSFLEALEADMAGTVST